jgi:hypothetical protein
MWMLGIALSKPALLIACWSLREASFHYTLWKYSREFKPGMTRKHVEDRHLAIRPDFHRLLPPATDYVDLGWVGPGVCSVTQVIALDFQMPNPQTIDDNDTLVRVELRRLNWGCM